MASPNKAAAIKLNDELNSLSNQVGVFFISSVESRTSDRAQALFNRVVSIFADPFCDEETRRKADGLAAGLHHWVIKPLFPEPVKGRDVIDASERIRKFDIFARGYIDRVCTPSEVMVPWLQDMHAESAARRRQALMEQLCTINSVTSDVPSLVNDCTETTDDGNNI